MSGAVQPDALRIAQQLEAPLFGLSASDIQQMADEAASELRVQHGTVTDLLAALKRLSAQSARLRFPGQPMSDAEKAADAAIAKAEGGAA